LDQVQGQAVAFQDRQSIGFNWQNGGGYGNANDGLGITEEGTGPLSRSQVPACVTGQRTHALTTQAAAVEEDGTGRGTPIVPVAFSAKDSGSDATEELSPTMRAMQHVGGNANAGGRSMPVTPESPTLEAGTGNKAPAVLAFANRTRDGVKVPEVMKDGVVPALTNPGQGGRSDAVNVLADAPAEASNIFGGNRRKDRPQGGFYVEENAEPAKTLDSSSGLNPTASQGGVAVRQAMQVRRLTPTECCRLQGFPDDHCDIVFRKKPAADGPKYRALGNSMAVPCMAWLGYRIQLATGGNNT